jgi:hypothetical protein
MTIMKTMTYYPTIFHTNPFAHKMSDIWDLTENNARDLMLLNEMATKNKISEMILNIKGFSAIDENGKEHLIKKFSKSNLVDLKGTHSGLFIKTKSVVNLEPGKYKSFRFHLGKTGNSFIYNDRSEETVNRFDFLDFEIRNGLEVNAETKNEVILRFDFEPYTLASFFKPLQEWFKKIKPAAGRMVESFSS